MARRRATPDALRAVLLSFDDRPSDSPLVERVWESWSAGEGRFDSIAASHWEMVVTHLHGVKTLTVRGPETRATEAFCPAGGEWVGIRFRLGTFLPDVPVASIRDRRDLDLPRASKDGFWLDGLAWEYPTFENAETFVKRLVRRGLIGREPLVEAVVHGRPHALSTRSAERRFLRATGLTHGAFRQIERARRATRLLREGMPILEVAHEAGYFDQAHLSRSLRQRVGRTPGEIARGETQLSFLYKTEEG